MLVIDTNDIDFVQNPDDHEAIFSRIRGALGEGPSQPSLPGMDREPVPACYPAEVLASLEQTPRRLGDFQQFHRQLDHEKRSTDPYLNFMRAARSRSANWPGLRPAVGGRSKPGGLINPLPSIREELADVLAYVIKLANYAGIDLEAAYLEQIGRDWSA